ncbi:ABC transporter ATP-binding protein [Ochrobactrum haematophilum]|uniref:ABC transporter ATP-binding protein n=1 Tax=Brucella haematophila TaxID=419474 RepID=A0ABX1DNT3_9HYPH|nr:ABC transporter ATP-binding protein [Brucella haematophila]
MLGKDDERGPNSQNQSPLIDINGVYKQYGTGVMAVNDMSLKIEQGQFVSFLGPSGCGKSTALRMIAGLESVSAGEIRVNGHAPGNKMSGGSSGAQDIGFVFQEPTLMPWASVYDNVYLPLRLSGVSRKEAKPRIEEVLTQVGLSRFANAFPRELSGGMKMRVSIARALVTRPRLLLMDEPFAALDEMTRFKLNNDVLRLWQEHGLTVIFVTHSVYESVYLSNRVIVMAARPGRVVADIPIIGTYPRAENYRTTDSYAKYCAKVSDTLTATLSSEDIDH